MCSYLFVLENGVGGAGVWLQGWRVWHGAVGRRRRRRGASGGGHTCASRARGGGGGGGGRRGVGEGWCVSEKHVWWGKRGDTARQGPERPAPTRSRSAARAARRAAAGRGGGGVVEVSAAGILCLWCMQQGGGGMWRRGGARRRGVMRLRRMLQYDGGLAL